MSRLGSHGGSGDEGRIRVDYKRIREAQRHGEPRSESAMMMRMAQRWKRPISEIRRILDKPAKNSLDTDSTTT